MNHLNTTQTATNIPAVNGRIRQRAADDSKQRDILAISNTPRWRGIPQPVQRATQEQRAAKRAVAREERREVETRSLCIDCYDILCGDYSQFSRLLLLAAFKVVFAIDNVRSIFDSLAGTMENMKTTRNEKQARYAQHLKRN